ncbi:hypothetical protein RclHR1_01260017 [Rhizophagus clarus]|uniref:Frequency clock protein n=1 Tax=Rhizophagus clarus TaxID=94130 RepID=A0A2Z6R0I4_9GLOM|nr:hypothetical protein RclHR1_01260017 [Rhizophagus clarus]GES89354.1 frequency clock protein [Rhizophagus clarus]
MSFLETTNLGNSITKVPINNTTSTEKHKGSSQTKRDSNEDLEMNLFLSDESSGNDQEMDEASGEASGETSNGSNSSNSKKSNSSISTTKAWFREFNQNTKELNKNNFDDDDSETPYYVNSYKTHPKHPKHPKLVSNQQPSIISRHQHSQRIGHHARIPSVSNHGGFHKKCEESSGSDSYRSVIDDLTLKNQKLRQKLRKLERIHSKSLHKEKLFEVRYYQMPREKRHELEEYLRQFAAQLSTPNSSSTQGTQNSINVNDSTENSLTPDTLNIKPSDKSKMKQVVRAIENVFTTKPSLDDHYLKDQEDADPQGYVYLNLLTNMAQLHTMSVTLPFVKQAIRTFSNCLELNEDGTKVRWRTGLDHIKPDQFSTSLSGGSSENLSRNGGVSEMSSNTGDKQSDSSPSNPSIQNYSSDQKNSATAYITPSSLTSSITKNQQVKSTPQITHYHPVFLHRNVSSSSLSSDESNSENDQHDGPVIYYEGGLFCTDFSRDVIIDDDDKPTTSSGTQSSPALDNSIVDDNNLDIFKERWNLPHYERATNSILGGNNMILNETSDSEQETDESLTKLCDHCDPRDHCSLTCSHISVDNSMIAVDDRHKENSVGINDELNKILMEKDIEFTLDRTNQSGKIYGEINDWSNHVSSSSPSTNNNSSQCVPDYKRLHTTKVPGIITEDNFMLLVQTSHPPEKGISHSKESSADNETNLSSSSNSRTDMGQHRPQQSSKSHKIVSTKLFQLPPSMSPQPRTSPPPGPRRTSFATRSKTSSSDSDRSSGYGSSSSSYSNNCSEPSSAGTSRDNSYLLKNNTLLQLSQSNNTNSKCSQYDEIQDMELDSLSSDSSDPSPFINIDADEDEEIEIKDNENNKRRKNRVEESVLGMNLRLQDAAVEERRKLADKAAPQEQRTMYLKNIMASSRAMIEALGDNKINNNVIDDGMDALPTAPLLFFNQQFNRNAQSSSSSLGVNNLNNNYNNDDVDL